MIPVLGMIAKCYRDGREGSSSRCGHRSCWPDRLQPPLPGGNLSILYTRVNICSGRLWICLWRRPGKSTIYCKLLMSCTHLTSSTQPLILHLLDIPVAMGALGGVVMELQDCALPLIRSCEFLLVFPHDCETDQGCGGYR